MTKLAPPSSLRSGAGRSAYVQWEVERRSRRRRLAPVVVLAVACVGLLAGAVLADAHGPRWLLWGTARPGTGSTVAPGAWLAPVTVALVTLAVADFCVALLAWPRRDPARWARGAAGEMATAEVLARLPARRWAVFHDLAVPGSRANIDHLVIGPTGVWVVDSKAYRARVKAKGGQLRAGTAVVSTEAVRWEAEVASDLLGEHARPLVAVHGPMLGRRAGGLGRRGRLCGGVRVVPAPEVRRRLRRHGHLRPVLSAGRVRQLASVVEERLSPRVSKR